METLAYQLHKRVLFSQLFIERFDVVCPPLHLRVFHEAARIIRVWVVMREEVTREYLHVGKVFNVKMHLSVTK